ncbi:MAG: GTP-binding protein [Fimbriimonas ginsengisoli]|uniref:GTP-binding protein n=1 Tax=Fimbriimonas ginsengisoli TaxID=1005039 RepID=A0A931LT35_FIMGI|nr:GTP-binding protein [Fimbriimonas ginsengisoli]
MRGIYLTAWSAGSARKMTNTLAMLQRTGLNTVVIDVRDAGFVYMKTGIKLADESHATHNAVAKPKDLLARLAKAGVYPIARIACFRDQFVPKANPKLAVLDRRGKVWKDRSGHSWLDPYSKTNWDYLGQIVDYALEVGFPEIQLDYVRFPSEGDPENQVFPSRSAYPDPKARPEDVIAAFAQAIKAKVKARGGVLSADVFGIISSTQDDQGIGQELEKIAAPFDLICPMVYPSHFAKGEYGIGDPNASPHAIVVKSLLDYRKRLPGKKIRPWLQDFSLGRRYGAKEVRAQIDAAVEVGYSEFLLWNAGNVYTEAAHAKQPALTATAEHPKPTTTPKTGA